MNRYTIALSGLSDTDADMFEAALDALPDNTCEIVEGNRAHLLVVDIDTVWGHMDWLRATANGQRVVAYTKDSNVRDCDLVLTKPLRARELSELLADLDRIEKGGQPERRTRSAAPIPTAGAPAAPKKNMEPEIPLMAATEAAPAEAPVTTATTEPEPEPLPPMTLGECLLADKLTHPRQIRGLDGTSLQLDPERGGYTGPATLKPLQPLLDMPMEEAETMAPDAIEQMREAPALPMTRLLWFAALSATPGELAPGLDRDARYHLNRWPQIEREFPRHFRIATSMMKGPGTLGDIASMANAPVTDVADFINAYSVAGYVACESASGAASSEPAEGGGSGMFSRLRRPFARSS